MAECGTHLSVEDIYRLITRVDGSDYYIALVDSGVGIEETEPLECWETMTEEDILNLILVTDGTNFGLNTIILT